MVHLGGHATSKGARVRFCRGQLGGAGGARDLHKIDSLEVDPEPVPALAKNLGMAVDLAQFLAFAAGHQVVFDLEKDLCANPEIALHEHVERMVHGALSGVLDRDNAIIRLPPGYAVKHVGNVDLGCVADACPELAPGGLVGVSGFRPEERNGEVFLKCERGRHDLAVNRADCSFGEPARKGPIFLGYGPEHLFLALRGVDGGAVCLFDHADFVDEVSALVEKVDQLIVQCVDFNADFGEVHDSGGMEKSAVGFVSVSGESVTAESGSGESANGASATSGWGSSARVGSAGS